MSSSSSVDYGWIIPLDNENDIDTIMQTLDLDVKKKNNLNVKKPKNYFQDRNTIIKRKNKQNVMNRRIIETV